MRLITGEGSKSMAVLRGAVMGLFVVILLFGGLITRPQDAIGGDR